MPFDAAAPKKTSSFLRRGHSPNLSSLQQYHVFKLWREREFAHQTKAPLSEIVLPDLVNPEKAGIFAYKEFQERQEKHKRARGTSRIKNPLINSQAVQTSGLLKIQTMLNSQNYNVAADLIQAHIPHQDCYAILDAIRFIHCPDLWFSFVKNNNFCEEIGVREVNILIDLNQQYQQRQYLEVPCTRSLTTLLFMHDNTFKQLSKIDWIQLSKHDPAFAQHFINHPYTFTRLDPHACIKYIHLHPYHSDYVIDFIRTQLKNHRDQAWAVHCMNILILSHERYFQLLDYVLLEQLPPQSILTLFKKYSSLASQSLAIREYFFARFHFITEWPVELAASLLNLFPSDRSIWFSLLYKSLDSHEPTQQQFAHQCLIQLCLTNASNLHWAHPIAMAQYISVPEWITIIKKHPGHVHTITEHFYRWMHPSLNTKINHIWLKTRFTELCIHCDLLLSHAHRHSEFLQNLNHEQCLNAFYQHPHFACRVLTNTQLARWLKISYEHAFEHKKFSSHHLIFLGNYYAYEQAHVNLAEEYYVLAIKYHPGLAMYHLCCLFMETNIARALPWLEAALEYVHTLDSAMVNGMIQSLLFQVKHHHPDLLEVLRQYLMIAFHKGLALNDTILSALNAPSEDPVEQKPKAILFLLDSEEVEENEMDCIYNTDNRDQSSRLGARDSKF